MKLRQAVFIPVLAALAWGAFMYLVEEMAETGGNHSRGQSTSQHQHPFYRDVPGFTLPSATHRQNAATGPRPSSALDRPAGISADPAQLIRDRLGHPDPDERIAAIQEVYGFNSDAAIRILSEVLVVERNGRVQQEAAAALAALAGESALAAVRTDLGNPDTKRRREAIERLGEIASRSLHLLGQVLLGDPEPELRLLALHSLAAEGSPAAMALIRTAAADPDPLISEEAKALISTRTPAVEAQAIETVEDDLLFGHVGLEGHGDQPILGVPGNSDTAEKLAAIQGVHMLDQGIAVRALQSVMEREDDVLVREEALYALESMGGEPALAAVAAALGDDSAELRHLAMEILWSAESPEMIPLLGQVLHADPDPGLRLAAVRLLAANDGLAARALLEAARSDPDERVRLTADRLLQR